MDDTTRYSIVATVVVVIVAVCVIGAFSCLDYFAGYKKLGDDNRTQVSTLTQSEDGRTPRKRKVRIEGAGDAASDTSSLLDDGTQIKTDKALLDTFVKVLSQGITVKVHSQKDKAPKEVKLSLLQGETLIWKSVSRSMFNKTKQLNIKGIKSIEWG